MNGYEDTAIDLNQLPDNVNLRLDNQNTHSQISVNPASYVNQNLLQNNQFPTNQSQVISNIGNYNNQRSQNQDGQPPNQNPNGTPNPNNNGNNPSQNNMQNFQNP